MKKFWKAVNWLFDWLMNLFFATILIGGGTYVIYLIFFS